MLAITKAKIVERVAEAVQAASLELLQGHSIWIGSMLKYLHQGIPFEVMKNKRALGWELLSSVLRFISTTLYQVSTFESPS